MIEENTYVVSDETRQAVIFDCGAYFPEEKIALAAYLRDNELTVRHAWLTHAHFDHIFGLQFLYDTYSILPEMHVEEEELYDRATELTQQFMHRDLGLVQPPRGASFQEGDRLSFGTHTFEVIHTPGHTPGGVCFYCADEQLLISGDSIFRHAIGRCDLYKGDETALVESLRNKILTLPAEVTILSGHGEATTVGEERAHNLYLR